MCRLKTVENRRRRRAAAIIRRGTNDANVPEMDGTSASILTLVLTMALLQAAPQKNAKEAQVGAQFRNVVLHLGNGVVLDVRELDGRLLSRRPGNPPGFDDIE